MSRCTNGVISLLLLFTVASCANHRDQYREIVYLGNKFILFESLGRIRDSLEKHDINIEYDDSFSGIERGVTMYSFQQQRDSLIFFTKLFFEDNKLSGLTIDVTSKKIFAPNSFLDKARNCTIKTDFSNGIVIDTSTVDVNPVESSTGQLFRLKAYEKGLRIKLPYMF